MQRRNTSFPARPAGRQPGIAWDEYKPRQGRRKALFAPQPATKLDAAVFLVPALVFTLRTAVLLGWVVFWRDGRFFRFPGGHLSSRTAILEFGRPSFFPGRHLCFPSLHLRKTAGRPSVRGVIFVPERVSFFVKAHPGVQSLHLRLYGRRSLPVEGGPAPTARTSSPAWSERQTVGSD